MHVRESIRGAVTTAVTGLTTTGTNVFKTRIRPLDASVLPCLLVYTNSEAIVLEDGTLTAPNRNLVVSVSGVVEVNTAMDDLMDDIAEEVETALGVDLTQGGFAIVTDLISTDIDLQGEAENQVGIINLEYLIQYRTPFGDPTTVA